MERPKLGALAVVPRDGSVLLVKRGKAPNKGMWGFPGGHVEWGETGLEAAARELWEETGVEARARRYLGCIDVIERQAGAVAWHYMLVAVLCDWVDGEPVAADDAEEARWVDPGGMDGLWLSANVDRVVRWIPKT
ncbi:NUDIX hydrolase [Jannaschia seohaensis]|uniref:ADP-ribose pyrophosphatase YjhB (NUDIX family) n=1 Tax=Jannaschia seohaensis TaxID=475081 RepID=A0A2Y9B3P6_9RHOB|nr:NUDIX hydrolase [Jannaschia seohaensis]PWJ14394.1 ADP-ribose pyrophosphatase YjhB (NUDIX family) [Jannaschia seohaensis]SSA50108.1 ADP-ribose pyrophosphatase YjhB, NUDIX family [Jannaschia seohaensis]